MSSISRMAKANLFNKSGFAQLLFESARDAIIVEDSGEWIVEANSRATELFGYSRKELLKMRAFELEAPESQGNIPHKVFAYPESTSGSLFETLGLMKNGKKVPLEIAISSFDHQERTYYLMIARDITERKAAEKEIFRMANIDPLTELPNRRYMQQRLEEERYRSERSGQPFSVMMADIDDFKNLNDNYGHDCGDYVLKQISTVLSNTLRKQDTVARWGGEEFLFLLPETDRKGGLKTAEKIRRTLEKSSFSYEGSELRITMTFGFTAGNYKDDMIEMIREADSALLLGKNRGKNCVIEASE